MNFAGNYRNIEMTINRGEYEHDVVRRSGILSYLSVRTDGCAERKCIYRTGAQTEYFAAMD